MVDRMPESEEKVKKILETIQKNIKSNKMPTRKN